MKLRRLASDHHCHVGDSVIRIDNEMKSIFRVFDFELVAHVSFSLVSVFEWIEVVS